MNTTTLSARQAIRLAAGAVYLTLVLDAGKDWRRRRKWDAAAAQRAKRRARKTAIALFATWRRGQAHQAAARQEQ